MLTVSMKEARSRLVAALSDRTHSVVPEWDGCPDENPVYRGTREQCLEYIRRHWRQYTKGKGSIALVNDKTGRAESFLL